MNFEAEVRIARPIEAVFEYVSDPVTFPRWNSAVQAVRKTSEREKTVGSAYSMERELPRGRVENDLVVEAFEHAREFTIRTTSGPTPFVYRYLFSSEAGETAVRLEAQVELDGAASLLGPLARRAVKAGVEANFATLKQILEADHAG